MESCYVLFKEEEVQGVYTDFRRAIHALMRRAKLPIKDFALDLGHDYYTDSAENLWIIEPHEVDKI